MKGFLKPDNFEKLQRLIGNPELPFKFKSIYTAIVWSPNTQQTQFSDITHNHIVLINKNTPRFPDDYFLYRWIRTSCPTIFETGNNIRIECTSENYNFEGNEDMQKYSQDFGTGQPQKQKHYIISKVLNEEEMLSNKYYKYQNYSKIIYRTLAMDDSELNKPEIKTFMTNNDIKIAPYQHQVRQAYIETLNRADRFPVLNNLGPQHLADTLDLIDYAVLTIYRGDLSSEFIGAEMPKISQWLDVFTPIFESDEFVQHQGFIKFYVLLRKQLCEPQSQTLQK